MHGQHRYIRLSQYAVLTNLTDSLQGQSDGTCQHSQDSDKSVSHNCYCYSIMWDL